MKNINLFYKLNKINIIDVKNKEMPTKFRNKFEYKMSLSDEKLERLQKIIIRKLCKSFADSLDFYNFSENHRNTDLK